MTTAVMKIETQEVITNSVSSKIEELSKEWLEFCDVQPTTFATYQRSLKNFTKWISDKNIATIDRDVVIAYRDSLLTKLAPTTCRLYIACLKLFIKFLASKGMCPDFTAHFKGVKLNNETHYRDALSVDESRQVFHAMDGTNEKSLRDKAIIGLMLATGLRCVEVTRLDVGDIERRGNKMFLRVHGKARQGKQDRVILPAQCASLIRAYLQVRDNVSTNSPLFVSTSHRNTGKRIQAQTISRLCKKALKQAGFNSPRLTAHSLRHSFATNAINAGVEIRQVSKALRHKSAVVTEIYLHYMDAMTNTATQSVANLIF